MRHCVLIMNPNSGKKKNINRNSLYDILRKYGYDAEIRYTKRQLDATSIVHDLPDDVDLVISAGGDGTLNEIVTGNMMRRHPLILANLPLGTTNDVGNMYGLKQSSAYENLELLLSGKPKMIDVCYIQKKPFLYVACLGDYIDMAYATPRELKKRYGKIAYILYGLRQLKSKMNRYKVHYEVDGEEYYGEYSFFFITNSQRIAGFDYVYYDIKIDDGKFEVAMADIRTMADMVKMFVLINTMDIKDIPGITYYQTNHFKLEFLDPPKTSWCIDGEEYKSTSTIFEFDVTHNMKMLIPDKSALQILENNK